MGGAAAIVSFIDTLQRKDEGAYVKEMTAEIEFEQQQALEQYAEKLQEDQLAMIAGGQCTTNSI